MLGPLGVRRNIPVITAPTGECGAARTDFTGEVQVSVGERLCCRLWMVAVNG